MAYAAQTDLTNVGLPSQAIGSMTSQQLNAILQNASDFADTFFAARWGRNNVPLMTWDTAVTEAVAKIAAYRAMVVRGFRAGSNADANLRTGYEDAVDWLNKVQRQQAHPLVTLANGATAPQQPNLVSSSVVSITSGQTAPNRGW